MFYLPEAELVRRQLERDTVGRKVKEVSVTNEIVLDRCGGQKGLQAALGGQKLESLVRSGTNFIFTLDNQATFVLLCTPSTLLRRAATKDEVHQDTVLTLKFTQGGELRIQDAEASFKAVTLDQDLDATEEIEELYELGMDPLATQMTWTDFGREILRHDVRLKLLLCDTSVIAALGDIYSDEILFEASLRYDRIANELNTQEIRRFYRSVVAVLNDAVKHNGTTLESSPWVDPLGKSGDFQKHLQVYERHGELSPRSRQPLVRRKIGGRWTYFCEQSQV